MTDHQDELRKIDDAIQAQEKLRELGVLTASQIDDAIAALKQRQSELLRLIDTGGGAYVEGDVNTQGGDFVNGDQVKAGDGGMAIGTIIINPTTGEPDYTPLRDAYLNHLLESAGQLTLAGIDPKAARENDTRLSLSEVYTALMTVGTEHVQQPQEGQDIEGAMKEGRRLSALEQLERHPRLVLLGDPGSGKSTFVNFVAMCLAGEMLGQRKINLDVLRTSLPVEEDQDEFQLLFEEDKKKEPQLQPWSHGALLPIRVILRDFAVRGLPAAGEKATAKHLWAFIRAELEASELAEYAEPLKKTLQEQGGLLLLDGLDEVPEAEQRRVQIKQAVEDFAGTFRKCRILVTSRTYAYQKQDWQLQSFTETLLAPFNLAQIKSFVERWYAHIAVLRGMDKSDAQGRAAALKQAINSSDRLQGLAGRPLLLTLMASLHAWRGGVLPEKREELYADTVDLLLDWWESPKLKRGPGGTVSVIEPSLVEWLKADKDKVRALLDQVAYNAHAAQSDLQGTADVAEDDLVAGLMRLSGNPDARPGRLIEYLSNRAGLLLPRGVGVYTFPHRTFQEYLAACHLTNDDYPDKIAELACKDINRWREVALLAGAKAGRGAPYSLWALVDALCCDELPAGSCEMERLWGVHLAGQLLAENIDPGAVSKRDLGKLERVQRGLVRVLQGGELPAFERVKAGDTLAVLGDPRFDPECWHLPREPMLGFVEVPAGVFVMGSEYSIYTYEKPRHPVDLPAYYIAKYPTTVAQFRVFVEESGYELRDADCLDGIANHPVRLVNWHDAKAYAKWLNGKLRSLAREKLAAASSKAERRFWEGLLSEKTVVDLPSEAEWEKAARDTDGRRYPWGDQADPNRANCNETCVGDISTVGCFPGGVTPYGALDMSGNVWEWTRSIDKEYPYKADDGREDQTPEGKKVMRGGSWIDDNDGVRCASRDRDVPNLRLADIGFRVGVSSPRK